MFRYNNQLKTTLPATIVYEGYTRQCGDLSREQLDEIGYNEALTIEREAFTTYKTRWEKGDDLIYREIIISAEVDETAQKAAQSNLARTQRDQKLSACDWTQLADCPLPDDQKTAWVTYRQALRDVPQQDGFPQDVTWPEMPESR